MKIHENFENASFLTSIYTTYRVSIRATRRAVLDLYSPKGCTSHGGCRSFCSPQTIYSAWGLQIVLQPPDHILSLGAADRSAAPRRSPQPGGCRSICSPQTISSAWGLQIVLQPPDDTIYSAWGLQIDLQPPDDLLNLGAADRSAAPRRYDLLSLGAADRSAAPRRSPQPGGCRTICSPQTISSAWGLQIVLQPPDHILSLGAADRSAAPRRSPQPGGCRSFCSPQTISSAWGLQIDLQPPDDLLSLGAADRSAAPRRSPQPGGCRSFCNPPPPPAHQVPPYVESSRATRRRSRDSTWGTTLIETLYQNIMELRTKLSLKEWAVKEREEEYNKLLEEYNKLKNSYAEIFYIAYKNSPAEQAEQPGQ
ncbi:hypothetical protein PGT21_034052 [Puccinia graminis f. sp. tritici]|uniref:Uncharacterized protein n=1 Tax=Puccinia graminis f. sp. tritici TaxID=56615 RepID=A0A5B0QK77_PUCGR|nr:hypothetical protein PGT21_034052 [Puccinia graminis f. sp. tritici]